MENLREAKKNLTELRKGKDGKSLFKDDWYNVNHRIQTLAKERNKLPLDLRWSGEELKRRKEEVEKQGK